MLSAIFVPCHTEIDSGDEVLVWFFYWIPSSLKQYHMQSYSLWRYLVKPKFQLTLFLAIHFLPYDNYLQQVKMCKNQYPLNKQYAVDKYILIFFAKPVINATSIWYC